MKDFKKEKLQEFDNKFVVYDDDNFPTISVASRVEGIKAFLSESIEQAREEERKEISDLINNTASNEEKLDKVVFYLNNQDK